MREPKMLVVVALVAACEAVPSSVPVDASPDSTDAPSADGPIVDTPLPPCDVSRPWGTPTPVGGVNTNRIDMIGRLSPDELTIYFQSDRDTPAGGTVDIYVATRATRDDPFGAPIALATVNSSDNDGDVSVSTDGLTLFLGRSNAAFDAGDIYVSTRTSTLTTFGTPAPATINHATARDLQPFDAGDSLWFTSERSGGLGGFDIYRSAKTAGTFATPVPLVSLNSNMDDWLPMPSSDGLVVYFSSTRADAGAAGLFDIWTSTRADLTSAFGPPTIVPELNSAFQDFPSWLSPDGCRLYLSSERLGSPDIYVATRLP